MARTGQQERGQVVSPDSPVLRALHAQARRTNLCRRHKTSQRADQARPRTQDQALHGPQTRRNSFYGGPEVRGGGTRRLEGSVPQRTETGASQSEIPQNRR